MNGVRATALLVVLANSAVVLAQPSADKPVIRTGDSWEFSRTDSKSGMTSTWTRTVVAVESADLIAVRWETGAVEQYDGALNWIPKGMDARVLVRYPIKVGDTWTFNLKTPNPNVSEMGSGTVKAVDTIEVPAGTLECYRIEYESTSGSRNSIQHRTYTRWYCPAVKWFGKEVVTTRTQDNFNPANTGETTTTMLLKRFSPGP